MLQQPLFKLLTLLSLISLPLFASVDTLATQSLFSILAGAFVAGILLTFTPCVFPMVPILSSIIVGEGKNISKLKALQLALAYVLGTAVTYALMGAVAGATGEQLQAYFQNTWAISLLTLLFVIMAFGMFGAFRLELPAALRNRLDAKASGVRGGKFFAVFLLGLISALVLSACVSPVLISFLSVAIANSNPLLGAQTMFALALGMGLPLVLLSLGMGYLLPKAGEWMDGVKNLFGIILLGVAIVLFSELDLISELFLWGVYFSAIGLYIGIFPRAESVLSPWGKLQQALAGVLLIWGVITLVGAAKGNSDIYYPLHEDQTLLVASSNAVTPPKQESGIPMEEIKTLQELQAKQKLALSEHKPIVIYFHATHCGVCAKLEKTTLKDPKVRAILKSSYVPLLVDLTDKTNEKTNAIKAKMKVFGAPAFVIIDAEGEVLEDEITYGYQLPQELFDTLDINAE